jgi:hypothetical protein
MQKQFDSRRGHLQVMLNELNGSIGHREKKYFHVNTIENLIFHFQDIKTENDKNWVYETLQEYLKKCFELMASIDRNISRNLFKNYIDKLTNYYRNNLGFIVLLNRSIVYLVYLTILSTCYFVFNIYVVVTIAFLFIIQTLRVFKKYREKKVYSLFW